MVNSVVKGLLAAFGTAGVAGVAAHFTLQSFALALPFHLLGVLLCALLGFVVVWALFVASLAGDVFEEVEADF